MKGKDFKTNILFGNHFWIIAFGLDCTVNKSNVFLFQYLSKKWKKEKTVFLVSIFKFNLCRANSLYYDLPYLTSCIKQFFFFSPDDVVLTLPGDHPLATWRSRHICLQRLRTIQEASQGEERETSKQFRFVLCFYNK